MERKLKKHGDKNRTFILRRTLPSPVKRGKKGLVIALITLFALNLLIGVIKSDAALSEGLALTVSRPWAEGVRQFTALLPFSLFELIVLLAVTLCVVYLVRLVTHARRRDGKALRLTGIALTLVLSFTLCYNLTAGFAYTRNNVDFPGYSPESREEALTFAELYFEDFFALGDSFEVGDDGRPVSPYSLDELKDVIGREYERVINEFPEVGALLYPGDVPVKAVVNSWFMSESNITGIYFAPTGEANINGQMSLSEAVVSMAHECAHGRGVMREDEANAVAYLLTLTSSDEFVRLSGYLATYGRMAEILYYYDRTAYEEMASAMPDPIRAELNARYEFWSQHGKISDISRFFNDLYLKLSGYIKGVAGYRDQSVVTPSVDPDTGETVYDVAYSPVQRMIFAILEERLSA